MVKKLLGSVIAFSLLSTGAMAADALTQKCKEKNQGGSFDNIIGCVKKELAKNLKRKGNTIAETYSIVMPISNNTASADYYDALNSSVQQAMLELRAEMVSKLGLEHSNKAMLEVINRTKDKEGLKKELEDAAKADYLKNKQDETIDGIMTGILNTVKKKFDVEDLNDLTPEQKEEVKGMAKAAIFSKTFTNSLAEKGQNYIAGMMTYTTAISDDGTQLGVVAYVSDRSMQLYSALHSDGKVIGPEDKDQCKLAEDVVEALLQDDEDRRSRLGTAFYWDQHCQPAVLSFAIRGFEQTDPDLKNDLKNETAKEAQMFARTNLAQFMGAATGTQTKLQEQMQTLKEAMVEVIASTIDNGGDYQEGAVQKKLKSTTERILKSVSKVNTRGMDEVDSWYIDDGAIGIVGSVMNFSVANKEAVNQLQKALSKARSGQSAKPAASAAPARQLEKGKHVIKTNVLTDDF